MKISEFSFKMPGEVIFGNHSIHRIPEELKKRNISKVLLVSDRGIEKAGLLDEMENIFKQADIQYTKFLDVEANPSIQTVEKGQQLLLDQQAEGIVCLGGGSPIDTAKAISIVVSNGGKIQDYEGPHKVKKPVVPVVAVPTTTGTGSEVTPFTVITDRSNNYKMSVFSYETFPSVAVLDPTLVSTLPPLIAASTGLDALTHAIEAYISLVASPFSDAMAEKSMELIGKHIKHFTANRADLDAASGMLIGSMFGGIAFSWGRLGNIHAMSHPLGGYFNIPHGIANAVLLPTILEYNAMADRGKYWMIYNYISEIKVAKEDFIPQMLPVKIRALSKEIGIPENLTELGVKKELIEDMSVDAMKSGNILVNPRQTTIDDIKNLYLAAME